MIINFITYGLKQPSPVSSSLDLTGCELKILLLSHDNFKPRINNWHLEKKLALYELSKFYTINCHPISDFYF